MWSVHDTAGLSSSAAQVQKKVEGWTKCRGFIGSADSVKALIQAGVGRTPFGPWPLGVSPVHPVAHRAVEFQFHVS